MKIRTAARLAALGTLLLLATAGCGGSSSITATGDDPVVLTYEAGWTAPLGDLVDEQDLAGCSADGAFIVTEVHDTSLPPPGPG